MFEKLRAYVKGKQDGQHKPLATEIDPGLQIENGVVIKYTGSAEVVHIPDGVHVIGKNAFHKSETLKEVVLPSSLEKIEYQAFNGCAKLEQVVFPKNLKSIGIYSFAACSSLKEIVIPDSVETVGYASFNDCANLESAVLPRGLEILEQYMFAGCEKLQSVVIPDSVKKIRFHAFEKCVRLTSVILPANLTELEENAFYLCTRLQEITLPAGLTALEKHVFRSCRNLRRAVLPDSLTSVSRYAFEGCVRLEEVECSDTLKFEKALCDTPFWKIAYPNRRQRKSLPRSLVGTFNGQTLRNKGYTFFNPGREYTIEMPDDDGVVLVSSWSSTEGPDSDGFGMEECYDWWYLDETLERIPGVEMVHDWSRRDKRNNEEKFQKLRDQAAEILRRRGDEYLPDDTNGDTMAAPSDEPETAELFGMTVCTALYEKVLPKVIEMLCTWLCEGSIPKTSIFKPHYVCFDVPGEDNEGRITIEFERFDRRNVQLSIYRNGTSKFFAHLLFTGTNDEITAYLMSENRVMELVREIVELTREVDDYWG